MKKFFTVFMFVILTASASFAEPQIAPVNRADGVRIYKASPVSMQDMDKKGSDADFGPYMRKLQRTIRYNWDSPANSASKRAVAIFTISKNGALLNYSIKESSGDRSFDDAAIAAIKASAPFDSFPSNSKKNSIEIKYTFDYKASGAAIVK